MWDGWNDVFFGIKEYKIEEFFLKLNLNNNWNLSEFDLWKLLNVFILFVFKREFKWELVYFGMYLFILNVVDNVNNL